ncbi:MAG: hypothetical protein WBQ61_22105 [Candidatus Acidiferrum sp.]
MKIRNILRTQAIVIGFGVALLLANSASAQEIVNTTFNDGPNVASFDQPATTNVALGTSTTLVADAKATVPAAAVSTPVMSEEAMVSLENSVDRWLIGSSLLGMAILAIYAFAVVRRANRNLPGSRSSRLQRPVASVS